MGQEVECTMRYRRRNLAGKAYLETDHLLFRGDERFKVALKDITGAIAGDGVLKLEFVGGPAELELGKAASKWRDRILHPPSRADKLGIKPGLTARLAGAIESGFPDELRAAQVEMAQAPSKVDLLFYGAAKTAELAQVAKLARSLKAGGALWIVYPKGVAAIREMDVLMAGREAGLKDTKVASFSTTHTALRFVIPLAQRS
jgi:hypothetical protein